MMQTGVPFRSSRQLFPPAVLLLLLTAAFSLWLSSQKLFWEDELFEFYSDSRPTVAAVIHGQRSTPFSLEPPAFHILLHATQQLPLPLEIATRLPSAAALLVTQVCLCLLTFHLTRRRDLALLALALPFALTTFSYSAEARVYSVLVATYAVSFVLYGYVLARTRTGRRRTAAAVALFATLAAGVLLHYYGILLVLPFLTAEAARSLSRRRVDWSVVVALLASLLVFVLNLPFLAGLRQVQAMYFDSGEARWNMVPFTFLWIVDPDRTGAIRARSGLMAYVVSMAILGAFAVAAWLLWHTRRQWQNRGVDTFLVLALTAGVFLPVVNIAIGIYKAHAYSPRYSLPVVVPLVVLACLILQSRVRQTAVLAILVAVFAAGCFRNFRLVRKARRDAHVLRASLAVDSTLLSALSSVPDPKIYIQDVPAFLPAFFYAPDDLKSRLVNVESVDREWFWLHSGPASLFSRYMQQSTSLPITTYEHLRQIRGPHLFVLYGASSEWLLSDLHASGGRVAPLGKALGGDLFAIDFTPPHARQGP